MAVEGIGSLVQNLADHQFGHEPATQAATRILGVHEITSGAPEDTFTHSTQDSSGQATAQDAGIFQLPPGGASAATLNLTPAQTTLEANPSVFPPQTASGAAPSASTARPAGASGTGTTGGQSVASPAAAAEVQNQIRALNAALPALGLTNNQIREIDRIASLIKDFNPSAYADLVRQFETQAQETQEQHVAPAPSGVPGAANSGTNPSSGIQVQKISNRFTGVQVTPDGEVAGGPAPYSPTNGNGQLAQVQPSRQAAGAGPGSPLSNQS